jgi:hypothetical protein
MGFTSILFTYKLSSIVIPAPRRIANKGMEIYKSFLFLSFFASISSGVNHELISFTPSSQAAGWLTQTALAPVALRPLFSQCLPFSTNLHL